MSCKFLAGAGDGRYHSVMSARKGSIPSSIAPAERGSHPPLSHVVIAGYGPVGRMVAERLESEGVTVIVIDLNPNTVQTMVGRGKRFILGSVADPAILHEAGIEEAQALILTIPDEDHALQACIAARALRPDLYIAARTNYLSKGMLASKAGADYVIVEELLTAQAMHDAVFEHLVLPHQGAPTPEPSKNPENAGDSATDAGLE